jgi:hypothetical protein
VTAARSEDGVFVVVSTSALSDDREARRNRLGRIILDEIEQAGLNAT